MGAYPHSFDFFEKGKLNFLIVVDAHSKWLEVIPIEVLHTLFTCYEIPEDVVSDNRPQLVSKEFF